jgi:hypothetical protein
VPVRGGQDFLLKTARDMVVAPGFAEPGMANQNRTRQKDLSDTDCTSMGVFFFGDFLLDKQKKVTRHRRAAPGEITLY